MAKGTIEWFAPGAAPTFTGWTYQNGGAISNSKTRVNELNSEGNELKSAMHDSKATTSFTYVCSLTTGSIAIPNTGAHANGWHIDSVQVQWDREQIAPKMTVNCHKHLTGTMHTECREYASTFTGNNAIAAQTFGVPSKFGTAFALATGAVVAVRSATLNLSCTHVDEPNSVGNELAGNNYDGVETLDIELTGNATSEDYTSTWDQVTDGVTPSNTGATTSSLHFEHHVSHVTNS